MHALMSPFAEPEQRSSLLDRCRNFAARAECVATQVGIPTLWAMARHLFAYKPSWLVGSRSVDEAHRFG